LECLTSETVKKETVLFPILETRRSVRPLTAKAATRAGVFSDRSLIFEAAE
jgi:hypothetical protein